MRSRCAHRLRNEMVFTRGAAQDRRADRGIRPYGWLWGRLGTGGGVGAPRPTECNRKCGGAGRCGERTERCQWQKQRSERVAAVKISSVRRKAAQKFWAPQQGHRPLRKRILWCVGEGLCPSRGRPQGSPLRRATRGAEEESPSHGFAVPAPFRQGGHGDGGGRIATAGVHTGFAMTGVLQGVR